MRRFLALIDVETAGRTPLGMALTTEQQQIQQLEVWANRLEMEKVVTRICTENVGECAALDFPCENQRASFPILTRRFLLTRPFLVVFENRFLMGDTLNAED